MNSYRKVLYYQNPEHTKELLRAWSLSLEGRKYLSEGVDPDKIPQFHRVIMDYLEAGMLNEATQLADSFFIEAYLGNEQVLKRLYERMQASLERYWQLAFEDVKQTFYVTLSNENKDSFLIQKQKRLSEAEAYARENVVSKENLRLQLLTHGGRGALIANRKEIVQLFLKWSEEKT